MIKAEGCCIIRDMVNIEIGINEQEQRLDKFLRKYLANAPLSYIYKAIRKDIKVNGKRGKEDTILKLGDKVSFYISEEELDKMKKVRRTSKAKRQFTVSYEDDNILIAVKPFGLLTHGDSQEKKNHLANQVVDYLIEKGDYNPRLEKTFTPAPVNRLDRNTTGLVLFAKNNETLKNLNAMIREKDSVRKCYLTIVKGALKEELYLHDKMVKDHKLNKITVIDRDAQGKDMQTIARPLMVKDGYTLTEVEIITGRTHQIRAHLAKAGYPIIGDVKYGDRKTNDKVRKRFGLSTQLLHAYKLEFVKCAENLEYLTGKVFTAEPAEDFGRIKKEIFG